MEKVFYSIENIEKTFERKFSSKEKNIQDALTIDTYEIDFKIYKYLKL